MQFGIFIRNIALCGHRTAPSRMSARYRRKLLRRHLATISPTANITARAGQASLGRWHFSGRYRWRGIVSVEPASLPPPPHEQAAGRRHTHSNVYKCIGRHGHWPTLTGDRRRYNHHGGGISLTRGIRRASNLWRGSRSSPNAAFAKASPDLAALWPPL